MQNFKVFVPLQKNNGSQKIKEINTVTPTGEFQTQYKIHGIASTTALDRDDERVSKNCMHNMVKAIKQKRLPIFENHEHNWENMLGYATDAEVINNDMHISIETDFMETNPKIKSLISKLTAGMPLGLSIGGRVKEHKEEYDPSLKKKIKVIEDVELLETSIVGIASNPNAFLSLPTQISKSLKTESELPTLQNLCEPAQRILRKVYEEARSRGYTKNQAINISFGGISKAGYNVQEANNMRDHENDFNKFLEENFNVNKQNSDSELVYEARCPECNRVAELRELENGTQVYFCNYDGTIFSVENNTKSNVSDPVSQPTQLSLQQIDVQSQGVLGKKNNLKGDILKQIKKTSEDIVKKVDDEEEEKCKKSNEENGESEEDEEEEYMKFKKRMERYSKEIQDREESEKAEGQSTVPGGEQANPEYSIKSHSVKEFDSLKKAIKDNMSVEGLNQEQKTSTFSNDLSFKSFKSEYKNK